jgi:hypothetical protein
MNIARYINLRRYLLAAMIAFIGITLAEKSQGQGTHEQRMACTEDAFKFCGAEIPDVPRITECMLRNLNQLSPVCRAQFKQPDEPKRTTAGRASKRKASNK